MKETNKMFQFFISLTFCLCLSVLSINCQIDTSFCDYTKIVPNNRTISYNPFQNLPTKGQYRYRYEKNKISSGETEEISAYLDLDDDIAVSHQRVGLVSIKTYSYYQFNEILVIRGDDNACGALKLTDLYTISPFYIATQPNGALKIKTPLQYLIEKSPFGFKNTLDGTVRGIKANRWQSCAYIPELQQTLNITVTYSGNYNST